MKNGGATNPHTEMDFTISTSNTVKCPTAAGLRLTWNTAMATNTRPITKGRNKMYEEWWGVINPYGDGFCGQYVEDEKESYGCGIESFRDYSFGYGLRTYNERQR